MVKEWLNSLLEPDYQIVRSPKSFNSQIGVPLSVWEMKEHIHWAFLKQVFLSQMKCKSWKKSFSPTIGVLTNIGEAHSEGFSSDEEKLKEKLKLFAEAEIVIGSAELLSDIATKKFTWSERKKQP